MKTNNNKIPSLIINATKLSDSGNSAELYEFMLDLQMNLVKCSLVKSLATNNLETVQNYNDELKGDLFELNHIRIDPMLNNNLLLHRFKKLLLSSGVRIKPAPDDVFMAICYKPIGELVDPLRFYIKDENSLVYLSQCVKLSVV